MNYKQNKLINFLNLLLLRNMINTSNYEQNKYIDFLVIPIRSNNENTRTLNFLKRKNFTYKRRSIISKMKSKVKKTIKNNILKLQ